LERWEVILAAAEEAERAAEGIVTLTGWRGWTVMP
jgi:hypothetical protein